MATWCSRNSNNHWTVAQPADGRQPHGHPEPALELGVRRGLLAVCFGPRRRRRRALVRPRRSRHKDNITQRVAQALGISQAHGGLLPEGKARYVQQYLSEGRKRAFAVKAVVLALGAGGLATMWEAVFADVGVALLAILNAVRIQRMNFARLPAALRS